MHDLCAVKPNASRFKIGERQTLASRLLRLLWALPACAISSCSRSNGTDRTEFPKWTALVFAAAQLDVEGTKAALNSGADPNGRVEGGMTPLMRASKWTQPDFINGQEHRAVEITRMLLKAGAKPDLQDEAGMTALMCAAGWHHHEVLPILLEAGADIQLRDLMGRSALTWAARDGLNATNVKALLAKGATVRLVDALLLGDSHHARSLLHNRKERKDVGPLGETALVIAAEHGYVDVVQDLLETRPDINRRDDQGMTPLLVAVGGRFSRYIPSGTGVWSRGKGAPGRLEVTKLLIARGAQVNSRSRDGYTALRIARVSGDIALADMLESAGATE